MKTEETLIGKRVYKCAGNAIDSIAGHIVSESPKRAVIEKVSCGKTTVDKTTFRAIGYDYDTQYVYSYKLETPELNQRWRAKTISKAITVKNPEWLALNIPISDLETVCSLLKIDISTLTV